jgi:regulator of CtrA degradation
MRGADSPPGLEGDPIDFGKTFVASEAFRELFREGMRLVEDTAAYLDGPGRSDSRRLGGPASLAYASESMRLTTRLMQIASWLLVQRAVAEGEITPGQALQEKTRVRLAERDEGGRHDIELLPETQQALIGFSLRLHARIIHLDRLIADGRPSRETGESPVAAQLGLLQSVFRGGR